MTSPPTFSLQVSADLEALPFLRSVLRNWLTAAGVRTAAADDIVLASWEACANAAEHPVGVSDGELTLAARASGDTVCISVRDQGHWRERPEARQGRGLGLVLVRGLMDQVSIECEENATVVRMRRHVDATT